MNFLAPYIFPYNTKIYPFADKIRDILGVRTLENIHEERAYDLLIAAKTDQYTHWHKKFYFQAQTLEPLYLEFLEKEIVPSFGIAKESLVFQKIPTFRVHLPGNVAVGEFHRDSDYNHREYELNLWLPFTNAYETNTIQIEVNGTVTPFAVNYGQVLVFNGAKMLHGNAINTTGQTRVSMDFRICDKKDFVSNEAETLNTKKKLAIGGYFSTLCQ